MLVNASSNALLDSAALAVDAVLTMTAIGIVEDNPTIRAGFTRAALSTEGAQKQILISKHVAFSLLKFILQSRSAFALAAGWGLGLFAAALCAHATDSWNITLQSPNGYHIPRIIGASADLDTSGFTALDYLNWFGITHHRYWFRLSFSSLNPTGGVTDVASFNAATAAVRADPWRQGTASDVYYDWNYFHGQFDGDYILQRFVQQGIEPMMISTVITGQNPLADWGNKFKYWKSWYSYVYYFASHYGVRMYEFKNEPSDYGQWESHWLVAADAMRKAMADVNANYGKNLTLYICGPTTAGNQWSSWVVPSWTYVQTDIYGNPSTLIWNYGMYDYHHYLNNGDSLRSEIASLRQNLANSKPSSTMPMVITEINTATGSDFRNANLDTEDMTYGIGMSQILPGSATLGPDGLGDNGGLFMFKIADPDNGSGAGIENKVVYMSPNGNNSYGGITRGGVCFQMYARHFRGGKPLLDSTVTAGSSSLRRRVVVWDATNHAYYVYLSNMNGNNATVTLNLSALDVPPGAPVTVARVDTNNTGQITDYLTVGAQKTVAFSAPDKSALLVWISQGNAAVSVKPPADDTYLVVGQAANHSAEGTMKVSLHHSAASERRIGFLEFDLSALANRNRFLLKLPGHNIGSNTTARTILHVYGAGNGAWSEAYLTWATALGVGKYHSSTNAMATTTGLGSMVDVEDNYKGYTSGAGTGMGLYGNFLGPVSFSSSAWTTNYLDVTDYVRSLVASNQTRATFVIAHIVRYNVNNYSNAYYAQGVYDYDGEITELGTKENTDANLRSGLVVWGGAPTNLAIAAAGPTSFSLSGQGGANQSYDIYASTNVALPMVNWWLVGTTSSDAGGVIRFLDTQATNRQRFYRFGQ